VKRTWLALPLLLALWIPTPDVAPAPALRTPAAPAAASSILPAVEPLSLSCGGTIYCETCAERGGHCVLVSGGACLCQR
jgi:hypothetical protein